MEHAAFLIDATARIATWNAGCEHVFGYRAEAILSRPVSVLLAPCAQQQWERQWHALPGTAAAALEIVHADGRHARASLNLVAQYRKTGKISGFIVQAALAPDAAAAESEIVGNIALKSMIDIFAGLFYVINRAGHFVIWNRHVEAATRMTPAELGHARFLDLFEASERPVIDEKIRQVFESGTELFLDANLITASGTASPHLLCATRFPCGHADYVCGMGINVAARRAQDEKLRLRERALHAASNGIVITRCAGKNNPIEYVNRAFARITGYSEEEVIGQDPRFMAAPGLDEAERKQLRAAIDEHREVNVVLRNLRKDGELFWNDLTITPVLDDKGVTTHFIGVINDVTASKQRTAHLEHEVNHDPLTGLANRNLLWDRLDQAVHIAQRNKTLVATVLIDLNNFKHVNDTLGHDAGDEVLTVIAKRLQAAVRDSDTVARLSGDEFVLVLSNQPSLRYTLRMIERLRQGMSKPVVFNNKEIAISASTGVSIFPHDGTSVFELVRAADVAMYHAKTSGKNDIHFFSADMKTTTEAKQRMETNLRSALEKDEIYLVFQPKFELKSGKIAGIEALLRWRHPEHGVLLPSSFLPEAQENGMIIPLGERVLDQVCGLLQHLRRIGFADLAVSMNSSYREFSQVDYIDRIGKKLSEFDIPPGNFELEIREEDLMRNFDLSRELMNDITRLGIKVSVGDFGAGVSSLSYLQQLPVTHLKMARSSVREIGQEGHGVVAKMIIEIGHNLHMDVIAEGVETRTQMDFLKSHGCDEIQGTYLSAPVAQSALDRLLAEQAHAAE